MEYRIFLKEVSNLYMFSKLYLYYRVVNDDLTESSSMNVVRMCVMQF